MTGIPLPPATARLKRVIRQAVAIVGGIDGAAATTGKGRSTCHRWASLNNPDLPCLDSALALDEVLVSMGKGPVILHALSAELGHVALDGLGGADDSAIGIGELLAAQAMQHGEFMGEIARGLADGSFTPEEKSLALSELDDAIATALRLRAALAQGAG